MNPSKRLASVAMLVSMLALSACNNEEEPLVRNTGPGPIGSFQALSVAEEVSGLAMEDHVLVKLVDVAGPASAGSCEDSGSRSLVPSAVADYDSQLTFHACRVDGITFSGSVEFYDDGAVRRVKFNGLTVDTTYNGGALKLVISGSLLRECNPDCSSESRGDILEIPQLALDGAITQYGRTVPVRLDIRDYVRELQTNSGVGINTQSLSVTGRVTKSGDYGTYDVDVSNETGDGQIFEGTYAPERYTTGKLYINDRLKAGHYVAIGPSAEYVGEGGATIEAGRFMHFTGKIDAADFNALLEWDLLGLPFLVAIFDIDPS